MATAAAPEPSAAEVAARFSLSDGSKSLIDAAMTASAFVDTLMGKAKFADAIRVLAHQLSARQAVWWGCLCVWNVSRPGDGAEPLTPLGEKAIGAAVRWVREPSEPSRRAAEAAGRAAAITTPAGCVAMAAFWSAGSMSPPGNPDVPCPPYLAHRVVGEGVIVAAGLGDPEKAIVRWPLFVQLGRDVLAGRNTWE